MPTRSTTQVVAGPANSARTCRQAPQGIDRAGSEPSGASTQATATASIGTDANAEDVRMAVKRLDMAASKGIIHPNQAARRKSRLMKKVAASS